LFGVDPQFESQFNRLVKFRLGQFLEKLDRIADLVLALRIDLLDCLVISFAVRCLKKLKLR
jgi:hypothetical protein